MAVENQVPLRVRWEEDLRPGPIGEYVEVIDCDPASRSFYASVDLNDPALLAQDGLPPAEGVPQFHQQMVYALVMTTVQQFEWALGRVVLWCASPFISSYVEFTGWVISIIRGWFNFDR